MKIFVTGANGYIGKHVVDFLYNMKKNILACDFSNSKINKEISFINVDILKEATNIELYKMLNEPDNVIHLAWQDGFNHYAQSHIDNVIKHFYFLKNLIDSGVKSITVMGTAHEVGYHEGKITENTPCNPLSYYGIAKNTLRQLLFAYAKGKNVSIKWLRAYYITGDDYNNHSVFTKLLQVTQEGKKEFPFTKGTNQFDFIDVNTLAKMISLASIQNEINGIINVCSGEPVALKDKAEEFIKEYNLDIKLIYGVFPPREYDSPVVYGDNSKIIKIMERYNA
ncbi:MAG: NAD(P)-dependent oxidoreductase [Bacteroidales bacterium]|nr:NAD(P)-dependent oxidoreductase [Bacteroidales bacterium]